MIGIARSTERWLWIMFILFFGTIVFATYLPVRPLVLVFPAWSLAVLVAMIGTLAAAVGAVFVNGWPTERK
jgi:polyferredoxin